MKLRFRFTIGKRLGFAFGVLLVALWYSSYNIYRTLNINLAANKQIKEVYIPSATNLTSLYNLIVTSKMLIKNWVYIERHPGTPDKLKLVNLQTVDYFNIKQRISPLLPKWMPDDRTKYQSLCGSIDSLFALQNIIMEQLNTFESYDDPMVVMVVRSEVEDGGEVIQLADAIISELASLVAKHNKNVEEANKQMEQSFEQFRNLVVWLSLILFFSVLIIASFLISSLVTPINLIRTTIQMMGRGIIPHTIKIQRSDEIGEISVALNDLISGYQATSNFSHEIGEGNLDSSFVPLSSEDVLGNSLINMRESLRQADILNRMRKDEDSQRNWISQGLAEFGELVRENSGDVNDMSFKLIHRMVNYLDVNQGGIFIINEIENTRVIELAAAYAYNKQKKLQQQLQIGEGLIGRCVQESETIYLTDIPQSYVKITSGLGDANPTSLLIVPLKSNDEVVGVVELASFAEIPYYQIDFVERVGEVIASAIRNLKINLHTAYLLAESQKKSQQLASQEEEMRQNLEEMMRHQEDENEERQKMKDGYENQIKQLHQRFAYENRELMVEIEKLKQQLSSSTAVQ